MPFYSFTCPRCNHEVPDIRLTLKEFMDGYRCPECGEKMETVIDSIIPFILRGKGWTAKSGGGRTK